MKILYVIIMMLFLGMMSCSEDNLKGIPVVTIYNLISCQKIVPFSRLLMMRRWNRERWL